MVITLGALLADVPHTRAGVDHRASRRTRRWSTRLGFERTSYEGPTGHRRRAAPRLRRGRPARRRASGRRCRTTWRPRPTRRRRWRWCARFEGAAGVAVDASELEEAAEDYERQVSAAVASDPEVKAFVERLESAMDEVEDEDADRSGLPSADTIAQRLPALPAPARARDGHASALLLRRRADDPVVAEACRSPARASARTPARRIPSAISADRGPHALELLLGVLHRHLLAGQHVEVALRRGLEPPRLARAHLVERQLHVLAQLLLGLRPCRSCSRSARSCRRAGGPRGPRGRAAGAGRAGTRSCARTRPARASRSRSSSQ